MRINNTHRGWSILVEFVEERERQNMVVVSENRTKKGARELQNLACAINYEKSQGRQSTSCNRTESRSKGTKKGNL